MANMTDDNPRYSCETCVALEKAGVTTAVREILPRAAEALEVFAPGRGHGDNEQIRRCKTCGTLYRYRYHYEYDVTGSWDEYYLWRLPDTARAVLMPLLGADQPDVVRDLAFVPALQHHDDEIRTAAALALWAAVDQGLHLDAALLPACETLTDRLHIVGHFCYYALLWYLRRGPEATRQVTDAMDASGIDARDTRFAWILRKELRKMAEG